jgi:hypothetical protein
LGFYRRWRQILFNLRKAANGGAAAHGKKKIAKNLSPSRADMMNLRELLGFNLFLQIFDGTASYFILSRGQGELNPFVGAAIEAWGLLWALVYWKVFVCALLVVVYSLGHYQPSLPLRGLTFTAIVYSALGFYLVLHLLQSA